MNIVITKTGNSILVVYNDESQFGVTKRAIRVDHISEIFICEGVVEIHEDDENHHVFTHDVNNTNKDVGIVTSVSGVTTDTLDKLFTQLELLIQ